MMNKWNKIHIINIKVQNNRQSTLNMVLALPVYPSIRIHIFNKIMSPVNFRHTFKRSTVSLLQKRLKAYDK